MDRVLTTEDVNITLDQDVDDQDVKEIEDDEEIEDEEIVEDDSDDEDKDHDDADEGGEDSDDADEGGEDSDEEDDKEEDKAAYAFKRKQRQLRKEKERAARLEEELAKKEAELAKYTKPKRPEVPPVPSPIDPDYEVKIAERDEALRAAERFDQDQLKAEEAKKAAEQDVINQRVAEAQKVVKDYAEKVQKLDLDPVEMQEAENTVSEALGTKRGELANYLLKHDSGPFIVKHLAKNEMDLDEILERNTVDAAVFIETKIVPKLTALKSSKKKSKAPKPHKSFKGRRKVKSKDPFLAGATFE